VKKLFCRREFLSQSRTARLYRHFGVEINTNKILLQKLGIRKLGSLSSNVVICHAIM